MRSDAWTGKETLRTELPGSAGRDVAREGVEAELVQQRRHGDMRIVRDGVAQRQRAMGGQLRHQPIGQRLDGVVVIVFRFGCLAADGDDGAMDGRRGGSAPSLAGRSPISPLVAWSRLDGGASSSGRT